MAPRSVGLLGRNLPSDGLSTKTCQHAEYVNHNCLPSEWGMAACRVMMIAERSMTMYTLEELDSMCALPMSSFYISHPCFPIYWICSIMSLTRVVWEDVSLARGFDEVRARQIPGLTTPG